MATRPRSEGPFTAQRQRRNSQSELGLMRGEPGRPSIYPDRDDSSRRDRADAVAINALFTQLGYPETVGFVEAMLAEFERDTASRAQVAVLEDQVVGMVATHLVPMTDGRRLSCRVVDLVVSAAHRRHGIGGQLMRAAENEARRGHATRVDLATANDDTDAHRFYESLGYDSLSRTYSRTLNDD